MRWLSCLSLQLAIHLASAQAPSKPSTTQPTTAGGGNWGRTYPTTGYSTTRGPWGAQGGTTSGSWGGQGQGRWSVKGQRTTDAWGWPTSSTMWPPTPDRRGVARTNGSRSRTTTQMSTTSDWLVQSTTYNGTDENTTLTFAATDNSTPALDTSQTSGYTDTTQTAAVLVTGQDAGGVAIFVGTDPVGPVTTDTAGMTQTVLTTQVVPGKSSDMGVPIGGIGSTAGRAPTTTVPFTTKLYADASTATQSIVDTTTAGYVTETSTRPVALDTSTPMSHRSSAQPLVTATKGVYVDYGAFTSSQAPQQPASGLPVTMPYWLAEKSSTAAGSNATGRTTDYVWEYVDATSTTSESTTTADAGGVAIDMGIFDMKAGTDTTPYVSDTGMTSEAMTVTGSYVDTGYSAATTEYWTDAGSELTTSAAGPLVADMKTSTPSITSTTMVPPTPQPTTQPPSSSQPPVTEPSTTLPPTTQPSTTQQPPSQLPTTQPPTTQTSTREQTPVTSAQSTQPPSTPSTPSPTTQAHTTQAPTSLAPTSQAPITEARTTQPPTTQPPTTQAPTRLAPTSQAPITEAPTTQPPTTQAPTTQAPTSQAPITQAPTTQPPTTQAPTSQAPTSQAPITQAPTSQAPTTQAPTSQAPITQAPTSQAPITQAPTTQPPTTQVPTTQPSTTQPPTTMPPSTQPPTTLTPTSEPQTTQPPVTQPRSTQEQTTQPPATPSTTRAAPATQAPSTSTLPPTTLAPTTLAPTTLPSTTPRLITIPPTTPRTHTTSTRPKTTTPLEDLCVNNAYIDSIGYSAVPGHCNKVVQCFMYRGRTRAVLRDCPAGLFWDQDLVLCKRPSEVPCFDDMCLQFGVLNYDRPDGCRSYYECDYGISMATCCEPGFEYIPYQGCVANPGCNDPCDTPDTLVQRLQFSSCKFLIDPYNPYGYLTYEHGGLRVRACPAGTIFSARQCGCRWMMGNTGQRRHKMCSPDFYMNFNNGFKELSGTNMAFDTHNVMINNGAGQFNGRGKIILWGFMNRDLGNKFAIRLRFKPDPTATEGGSIISNCGMNGSPTVEIAIDNHQVTFLAKSMQNVHPTRLSMPFDPYDWNEVVMFYDGQRLMAGANGEKIAEPLGGILETRSNAIVLGSCPKSGSGFRGLIDEVAVYNSCIPRRLFNGK